VCCTTSKAQVSGEWFFGSTKNQQSFATQWAEVMEQAGQDAESHNLKDLAQQFGEGLRAYDNDEYAVTLKCCLSFSVTLCWSLAGAMWLWLGGVILTDLWGLIETPYGILTRLEY
jgi:hypothetical protein